MKAETVDILQKIIDGLDIEISTIQSDNLPGRVNVKNGRLIKKLEKSFVYGFDLDDLFNIPENTFVEINCQNNTYKGSILSCTGIDLLLAMDAELPADSISQLILILNRTYYLEKLKGGLERIQEKHAIANEDLVMKSLGLINMNPVKDSNIPVQNSGICLDEYQQECIQHCLGSEVAFVWGMPGTGKTLTIAHLIDLLAKSNDSILFLASSDSVVDSAIEKYFTLFKGKSHEIDNGEILRCGLILKDEIRDFVNEAGLIERKRKPRIDNIAAKQEQVKSIVEQIKLLQNDLKERDQIKNEANQLKSSEGKLSLLKDEMLSTINSIKDIDNNISSLNNQVKQKNDELKLSESMGSVSRMMKGIASPDKIKQTLDEIKENLLAARNQKLVKEKLKESYQIKITETEAEITKLNDDIKMLSPKHTVDNAGDIQKIQNNINELTAKQKHILYEISKLNNEIQEIEKITVNETKIIAAPLNYFYSNHELSGKSYDVVIIDEVAKLKLPEVFFASSVVKKKIIYIGDFLVQQPVIHAEENEQVAAWVKRDIFKVIGIGDRDDKKVILDPRIVTLRRQRKMPEAAAEILNNCLYEKRILTAVSADNLIPGDRPVSLFDTSVYNPYSTVYEDNYGRINIFNALLCISIAQKYCNTPGISDIGIATLYNEQADLIIKIAGELGLKDKIYANVIQHFNNSDRDIIILDIPEGMNSKGCTIGKILGDGKLNYLYGSIISRAKKKLAVVVNRKYLLNKVAALDDTIIKILGTITKSTSDDFEVVEPSIIIPELTSSDENNIVINEKKILHLSKDAFFTQLNSELGKEIKEMVIYSPNIDKVTADKYDTIFKELKNKGSNIAIVSLPLKDQNQNVHDMINDWINSGINFRFVDGLIEKLIIINNEIVYFGNVNILNPTDEKSSMFKICGQEIAKEIAKIYAVGLFSTKQRSAKVQKEISEDLPF